MKSYNLIILETNTSAWLANERKGVYEILRRLSPRDVEILAPVLLTPIKAKSVGVLKDAINAFLYFQDK